MKSKNFGDFMDAVAQYCSSNDYSAVDTSNRLGRFAIDEFWLVRLGFVKKDTNRFNNDYSGGWLGKYLMRSKEHFLGFRQVQDTAFEDILHDLEWSLMDEMNYDGQFISGQVLSMSGILAAGYIHGDYAVRKHLAREVFQSEINETFARFHGYEVPFETQPSGSDQFVGSDGPDTFRGYGGEDRFLAKGGNDIFDGGDDEDTIVLPGSRAEYSFSQEDDPSTWHIKRLLCDGSEEHKIIRNVELITFELPETIDLRGLPPSMPCQLPKTSTEADWERAAKGDLSGHPAILSRGWGHARYTGRHREQRWTRGSIDRPLKSL